MIKFAIIDNNVLTGLGLQSILEDIVPMADITLIQSFEDFQEMKKDDFKHFFVASRIYFEHAAYFRNQTAKSIVLVNGDMTISGVKTINVCQSEKTLVKDIVSLCTFQHGPMSNTPIPTDVIEEQRRKCTLLSPREVEVAVLLSMGDLNKEVADKLCISLATVITHRRNIMEKLHARSLADIIVFCIMNGLVDLADI